MSLKDSIDLNNLPKHIAIIMDGNGRWAKSQGKNRLFGHTNGVTAVRETAEGCAELGVKYLTLYAFSTENWNRPILEVTGLMDLLLKTIKIEVKTLQKNNIRLKAIGDIDALPGNTARELRQAKEETAGNTRMDLILALNYSGKAEIMKSVKQIAEDVKQGKINVADINEEMMTSHLYTAGIPDPELMVRTSGEQRISNFLLWQLAYAEFYFTEKFWPDFDREELYNAILTYQNRERRFGKTTEQIKGEAK
ncbi:MAG: Isoprenyl transferase [Bacteroidetes bacterium]|nr:Isoprenyl transferase [Bacteroidota bacterium]